MKIEIEGVNKELEKEISERKRLVENAPFVIGICDPNGRIYYINKRHEAMFGYPIESIPTTADWMARAYPDEEYRRQVAAQWNDDIRRTLNGEFQIPPIRTYRITSADGTIRDVEISFSLVAELMYVLFYDVTERVRAQDEVLKLIHAIEQSPVLVVITNRNGDIQYVNEKFCRVTGYAREEAVDKNPRILKSGEHPPEFYKNLWDTILSGRDWRGEFHNKKKNGELYWENATISATRDARGEITHFVAVKEDITEKKRLENLLSESEEKYRQFFAAESNAIMLVDADTNRFVDANEAALKLYQYTREEFLRLSPLEISAEPEKTANATKKIAVGQIVGIPLRYHKKKDGMAFPVEISTGAFMLKGRKMLFGVCRDISRRIEEERKLQVAEKQLMLSEKLAGIGRLSAGVCHEILNPLNIISLQTQLLLRSEKSNPSLLGKLAKIMNEIRRTEKIVGALMTFARKGSPDFQPRQINTEIDTVLSLIEQDFNLDGIKIIRDYQTPLPEIKIDADEMRQVFMNLVSNAKYAMRGGGVLTIKTRLETIRAAEFLRIYFSDTGVGIKKENLSQIFDPFFTTKPEGEGTGIGLSIAHGIVEKHDGTIMVENEEGKGVTFIINLPCDNVQCR